MTGLFRWAFLAVILALAIPQDASIAAQEVKQDVTIADLEDLTAAIENDQERAVLVQRLHALIELKKAQAESSAPPEPGLGSVVVSQLEKHSEALGQQMSTFVAALLDAPAAVRALSQSLTDPASRQRWITGLLALIAVIVAGLVASRAVGWLLKRPIAAVSYHRGEGLLVALPLLIARLVLTLIPPVAFAAAGWGAVSFFGAGSIARPIALSVIYAASIAAAINAVARTILSPSAAAARPLKVGDESAQYAFIWTRRISGLAIYGYLDVKIAGYLGLPAPAQALLVKLVGLGLLLLSVMLVMQNRKLVASAIGGKGEGRFSLMRQRLADLWHVLAILYLIVAYLVWMADMPGGFAYVARATILTVAAVAAAAALLGFFVRLIDSAFSLSQDVKDRYPGLEERVNRYLPAFKTTMRAIVWLVATLVVLQAWGVDILLWLSEPTGRAVLSRLASIGAIILLALAGWEALSAGIERYLSSDAGAKSQRARTLLPLARKAMLTVLTVVVGLTVLSELGIDIAPLLAGAGVVGLAVGFGAQTLVRDIITGLFILIEDTISVGDYVIVADHGGTVEALSIRSIRLRDPSGIVHTIPFSDVTAVVNYTREFAYAVVDIGVAYKEDIDAVSRAMSEVGAELRRDPEFAPSILDDLQVQGLDSFADSAIVIKARIKTAPGAQWAVRRAYNRLLKQRFDAEGIEIPFPQQTVWFGEADDVDAAKATLKGKRKKAERSPPVEPGGRDLDGENDAN